MCLLSCPWSQQSSLDAPADTGLLCDKAVVPGDTIKGTAYMKITAEWIVTTGNSVDRFQRFGGPPRPHF